MLVFWFVLLASLLVLYLASPWFGADRPLYEDVGEMDDLLLERERTYNALADLDFDYEAGKLSEEDYRLLRQQLLSEAADVLRTIDALSKGKPPRKDASAGTTAAAPRDAGMSEDSVEAVIARYKKRRQRKQ